MSKSWKGVGEEACAHHDAWGTVSMGMTVAKSHVIGGIVMSKPRTPPEGRGFYAWKKSYHRNYPCLVKLWIPPDAQRVSPVCVWLPQKRSKKCRASKVKVIEVLAQPKSLECWNGSRFNRSVTQATSHWGLAKAVYRVNRWVHSEDQNGFRYFNGSVDIICAEGIHFFMKREQAESHNTP